MAEIFRQFFQPQSKRRDVLLQVVLVAVLASVSVFAAQNAQTHYERIGEEFGFDFLTEPAHYEITEKLISFEFRDPVWRALLIGALNSVLAAFLAIVLSTCLAALIAFARLSRHRLLTALAEVYCNVFRNVPLLVQLVLQTGFWYAALRVVRWPSRQLDLGMGVFLTRDEIFLPWVSDLGASLLVLMAGLVVALGLQWISNKRKSIRLKQIPAWYICGVPLLTGVIMAWLIGITPQLEFPTLEDGKLVGGVRLTPNLIIITVGLATYASSPLSDVFVYGLLKTQKTQADDETPGWIGNQLRQSCPQFLRIVALPAAHCHLVTFRNTAFGVTVGYFGFLKAIGTTWTQTSQVLLLSATAAGFFLAVCLPLNLLIQWYQEQQADRGEASAILLIPSRVKRNTQRGGSSLPGWLKQNFFYDLYGVVITILLTSVIVYLCAAAWDWFAATADIFADRAGCNATAGSCWSLVAEKFQFSTYIPILLAGHFPVDAIWRAYIVIALFLGLLIAWTVARFSIRHLVLLTLLAVGTNWYLSFGLFPGSSSVEFRSVGGLLVTLLLTSTAIVIGFASGGILALGSFSKLPLIHLLFRTATLVTNSIPPVIVIVYLTIVASILLLPENATSAQRVIVALLSPVTVSATQFAAVIRESILSTSESTIGYGSLAGAIRRAVPELARTAVCQLHYTTFFTASVFAFDFFEVIKSLGIGMPWLEFYSFLIVVAAVVYLFFSNLILFAGRRVDRRLKAQAAP